MSQKPTNSFLRRMLKTRLGRMFMHSGFIAAVMGTCAYFLIGFSPDRYLFKIQRTGILNDPPNRNYIFYADLNSDGIQERFTYANGLGLNAGVVVIPRGDVALDQWNFIGSLPDNLFGYLTGDYDHDRSLEIPCFSVKDNVLFLNMVEQYGDTTHLVKNRRIDTIWTSDYNLSVNINYARFCDLNRDGFDELLFSLSVGHSRQPRRIYAYDIKDDSLWSSPLSGLIIDKLLVIDFDRDGRDEIFCENSATNNYPEGGISYPDTASWFVVLDDRLNYKVPPIVTGGLFSRIYPVLIETDGGSAFYVLIVKQKDFKSYNEWYLINPDFSLSPANPFLKNPGMVVKWILESSSGTKPRLMDPSGHSFFVLNGRIKDSITTDFSQGTVPIFNYQAGIPQVEYAMLTMVNREGICLFNQAGKKLGSITMPSSDDGYRICWSGLVDGRYQLLLSGRKYLSWYSVRTNPWQYWQYLILIGLIGGFYGFITFIRFIQTQQVVRQEGMRKEVLELQLKAVRNQLDPHFTFNALNALSALSMMGDTKGIDQFIGYFSRLLRTYLNTSDQVLVSLRDEIEFVVNYVELQRIRFDHVFRMVLEVSKETDLERKVPKMLIQTHVENAIKHGLRPKGDLMMKALDSVSKMESQEMDMGVVKVMIAERDQSLSIVIEDNGVGRGNSTVSAFESTGKGLKALDGIISSVKQLYKMEIIQVIEDLKDDEGKPAGTRVRITIF